MVDAGRPTCQKARRLALVDANTRFNVFFVYCFGSLNVFWVGKGVYSVVSNGAGGVLVVSMGGIPSRAMHQKARHLTLANGNVCLYVFFFIVSFVKHFCGRKWGV